jgi:hypothetical protein
MWDQFGNTINNAFYFVLDKIIDLQRFFREQAKGIGSVVLLIAILSAAFNYALTGTGLKENIIKILKATLFFLIVIGVYPRIISFITTWTYSMAEQSVYPSVSKYFNETVLKDDGYRYDSLVTGKQMNVVVHGARDSDNLFGKISETRETPTMNYTVVAPTSLLKLLFFMAYECMTYAEEKTHLEFPEVTEKGPAGWLQKGKNTVMSAKQEIKNQFPDFARILKGLICAFFIIFTGIFALLEYIVCYLEFMLVASVGVILFPLSIWEPSKFMAEKYIGALVGFFIKLLLCNIAIFLLIYGFVSLFKVIGDTGFVGTIDQIIFIFFICLMYLYICKSAPGIAQSLLTGSPSLNAAGAISAVAGAAAGAAFVANQGRKAAGTAVGTVVGGVGAFKGAGAAGLASKQAGGSYWGAFGDSLKGSVGDNIKAGALGLTRSLMGINNGANPHSWKDHFATAKNANGESLSIHEHYDERRKEGVARGLEYAKKHGGGLGLVQQEPAESPAPSVSQGSSGTTTA